MSPFFLSPSALCLTTIQQYSIRSIYPKRNRSTVYQSLICRCVWLFECFVVVIRLFYVFLSVPSLTVPSAAAATASTHSPETELITQQLPPLYSATALICSILSSFPLSLSLALALVNQSLKLILIIPASLVPSSLSVTPDLSLPLLLWLSGTHFGALPSSTLLCFAYISFPLLFLTALSPPVPADWPNQMAISLHLSLL